MGSYDVGRTEGERERGGGNVDDVGSYDDSYDVDSYVNKSIPCQLIDC